MTSEPDGPARLARGCLWLLAVPGAVLGIWAGLAPRSFYDDFPGLGQVWISTDGPFNQHLVRDVGWLYLALAIVTVWAAVTLHRSLVTAAAVAWLVQSVPHLVYHVVRPEGLDGADLVFELASLAMVPVLAVVTLAAARRAALRPS